MTPILSSHIKSSSSRQSIIQCLSKHMQQRAYHSVGFIGLGNMGNHMAYNIAKTSPKIFVYDVNEASLKTFQTKMSQLQNSTLTIAKSPAEIAQNCDVVITMLPSSPHVLSVYKGDNGILQNIKKGSLLIDSSTIDPKTAQEVAKAALEKETDLVDAPVSGGVGGAEAGTLTFMVGGSEKQFQRATEVLQKMGKNIVHCGTSGTGQVAKLCNNLVLGIEMSAVAEGMNLGVKLGMDPKVLAGIFNSSTARCWSSDTYNPVPGVMPNVPSSREYTGGFYSALMLKDLGLAKMAAEQAGVSLTTGAKVEEIYRTMCEKHGYSQKDFSVIYQYFREHMTKK